MPRQSSPARAANRPRSRNRRGADRETPPLLFVSTAAFLAACVLLGGDVADHLLSLGIIAAAGTWLLFLALYHGGGSVLGKIWPPALLLLALVVLLPFVQLVPLPAAWWHGLPGRGTTTAVLDAIGQSRQARPISLDLTTTGLAAAAILWFAGLVLATMQLASDKVRKLLVLLFALGVLQIAIGMLQLASHGALFGFYRFTHSGALIGTFSNKNHTGLFLALALLAGSGTLARERFQDRRILLVVVPVLLVFLVALVATFSRAGLFLGVIAIAVAAFLVFEERLGRAARTAALIAFPLAALCAILGSTDLAARALGRFGAVAEDVRWTFWVRSWPLAKQFFPVGGGLGSFPTAFAAAEQLAWLKPTYLNHAHNDYLEFVIEAGAYAIALIGLALIVLLRYLFLAWRARDRSSGMYALLGGAMVLLCAIHSAFDYPLRRIAIAAVFFFGWGLLLRAGRRAKAIADER